MRLFRPFARRALLAVLAPVGILVAASSSAQPDAGASGAAAASAGAGLVTPPDLDDVEHMCALLTGCDRVPIPAGMVPRDFASCVRVMYSELASPGAVTFSLTLKECGLRASSCGALRSCALRGARPDVCAGRGKTGPVDLCDHDGRAITCSDERISAVRDCPRGGEQCAVREGRALCALGACDAEGPPTCSASGTRILTCRSGKLVSLDCAAFGLRCVTTHDGPKCATRGAACTDGAVRCESGTSVGCHYGHEVRVDCSAAGLACGGGGSVVGGCTLAPPKEGACDPAASSRCDGATLRWCAWGKPRSYLCKSMGLTRCVSDDKSAHCAG
jgi:hypothetical protein